MAGTVTVGCKLPNGIVLALYPTELPPMGVAPVPVSSVTLRGSRYRRDDNGIVVDASWGVRGGEFGYGITEGVDEDFWNAWSTAHADYPPVKDGLIFALAKAGDVAKEADNRAGIKSGLEAIDPDKPAPGIEAAPAGDA